MFKKYSDMYYEDFFIKRIECGLKLQGLKLTDNEVIALMLNMTEINRVDELIKPNNKTEWNNKFVEALRLAYDDDVRVFSESKDTNKKQSIQIEHPTILWSDYFSKLYENSQIILSGIVQNWYFKHFKQQARASVMAGGCLSLILIPILFIILICFLNLTSVQI